MGNIVKDTKGNVLKKKIDVYGQIMDNNFTFKLFLQAISTNCMDRKDASATELALLDLVDNV